jgi:CRISPR-associated protein Csb1
MEEPDMSEQTTTPLTYDTLRAAVQGDAAAFRIVTDLDPAGGDGDKVFPPTYQGGVYARETRMIDGQPTPCVLLDSVQSQANRLELALLAWHRSARNGQERPFPLVQIDFAGTEAADAGIFTALEAPHRIADAVFLASQIDETDGRGAPVTRPFRHPQDSKKSSAIGQRIERASAQRATALFEVCPTALVFGMWDSHGARGGLGEKFQRALVSEVFGVGATADNRRPASRVDPLLVVAGESLPITINDDRTWSLAEKGTSKSRLSHIGLGNVTPSLQVPPDKRRDYEDPYNHGGVTIRFARQIAVLSLPALRRLRFPIENESESRPEADAAARATLAALGLAALARQWESGFSLRSRCDLVPRGGLVVSLVRPGSEERLTLTPESADDLLRQAVFDARKVGLPWPTDNDAPAPWQDGCLTLRPRPELAAAVARSRAKAEEERE